ncbi:MAG: SDR family oxidoreductase, partial [Chitinophagaceae bacterium]
MNIIVTGASRGIGKAIAAKFITEGWNAAICSLHADHLRKAKAELSSLNPHVDLIAEAFNAGNKSEVITFAQKIKNTFNKIDVLINNAGIFIPGSIYEEKEDVLENTMAVNLYSAYYLTKAMLPEMIKQKKGHIFNICSTASLRAYPNGGSYSISKFALLGFSKNLREEMKSFGIKVTAVCPGPTLTDSWEGFDGPSDRMMKPEDIADIIWAA